MKGGAAEGYQGGVLGIIYIILLIILFVSIIFLLILIYIIDLKISSFLLNVIDNILKTGTYGEGGGNPSQSGPSGGEGGGNPEPPRGPRPPYHYAGNNPEGDKEKKVRKSPQKRTKEALEASLQKYRDENPYPMTPGQSMEEYNLSTKRKEAKLYTLANKREAITGNRDKKIYRSTIEIAKSREEVKLRLPQKANETSEEYEKRIIETEFSLTHNKTGREKKRNSTQTYFSCS